MSASVTSYDRVNVVVRGDAMLNDVMAGLQGVKNQTVLFATNKFLPPGRRRRQPIAWYPRRKMSTEARRRLSGRRDEVGAHVSIAGGLPLALERAAALQWGTAQIFVTRNRQPAPMPLRHAEAPASGAC